MVVDPQADFSVEVRPLSREHAGGSHVGADNKGILRDRFHRQTLQKEGEPGGDLRISKHPGGFSQQPQPQAQGGGAAQSIPVGPPVGEDQEPVVVLQDTGGFIPGQFHPASPPGNR